MDRYNDRPFHNTVSNKIIKLLKKRNIRLVHIPKRKAVQMLRSAMDKLQLKFPGVYMVGLIKARCKEHQQYICLYNINMDHHINFSATTILNRTSGYLDCLVKKAIEIHLNKNNFNIDGSFMLSQAWSPLTSMLLNGNHDQAQHVLNTAHQPFVSPPVTRQESGHVYHDLNRLLRQFLDDKDRDGSRNIHLLAIQPSNVAASPRIFYCTCL